MDHFTVQSQQYHSYEAQVFGLTGDLEDGNTPGILGFDRRTIGNAVVQTAGFTSALVNGLSGSVLISHDGHYGSLSGKAVALEPATGFAFDTPMVPIAE